MENLNSFWHWFVIAITVGSILGCWWLLHWTKGVGGGSEEKPGDADDTGHVWDENIHELNTPLPRWWLWLFNITIVFGLVYLAIFPGLGNIAGLVGWTQESQYEKEMAAAAEAQEAVFARFRDMTPEQLIADTEAREIVGRLFGNNCAMCHGADGRGAKGFPNLADGDWQWGGSFDDIMTTLENGRQVKLSGFGNFDLREKKQRPGRNPKTGEEIPISARRVVTFRPGQKLKARVEAYAGSQQQQH